MDTKTFNDFYTPENAKILFQQASSLIKNIIENQGVDLIIAINRKGNRLFEDFVDHDPVLNQIISSRNIPFINNHEVITSSENPRSVLIFDDVIKKGDTVRPVLNKVRSMWPTAKINIASLLVNQPISDSLEKDFSLSIHPMKVYADTDQQSQDSFHFLSPLYWWCGLKPGTGCFKIRFTLPNSSHNNIIISLLQAINNAFCGDFDDIRIANAEEKWLNLEFYLNENESVLKGNYDEINTVDVPRLRIHLSYLPDRIKCELKTIISSKEITRCRNEKLIDHKLCELMSEENKYKYCCQCRCLHISKSYSIDAIISILNQFGAIINADNLQYRFPFDIYKLDDNLIKNLPYKGSFPPPL